MNTARYDWLWTDYMQRHVNEVASVCFHHSRRLKQIRRLLEPDVTATLTSAFVLTGLLQRNTCSLVLRQRAQNAADRLISRLSPYDHVTSTVRQGRTQDLPRGTIASAEREPNNSGVWGRSPQRGPGAEPLVVSGWLKAFCSFSYKRGAESWI